MRYKRKSMTPNNLGREQDENEDDDNIASNMVYELLTGLRVLQSRVVKKYKAVITLIDISLYELLLYHF